LLTISAIQEVEVGWSPSEAALGNSVRPYLKNKQTNKQKQNGKQSEVVVQLVKHLPSNSEAQSSIPRTAQTMTTKQPNSQTTSHRLLRLYFNLLDHIQRQLSVISKTF
jgi:hypothetical protein